MDRNAMLLEIRERIVMGGGIGHIRHDELDWLVGKELTTRIGRELMLKRLEWVANAKVGQDYPTELFMTEDAPNSWGQAMSEMAQAALDELAEKDRILVTWAMHGPQAAWRPIAEVDVPPASEAGDWWSFPCLLQDAHSYVGEGFCRYITDNRNQGRKAFRRLRWYFGAADRPRDTRVCSNPRYFMPIPAARKDQP